MLALNDVHQAKTKRGFADVYIRPPVENYNILDFGAYAPIAGIGYDSAMQTLAEWAGLPKREAAVAGEPVPCVPPAGRAPGESITAPLHQTLAELDDLLARMN